MVEDPNLHLAFQRLISIFKNTLRQRELPRTVKFFEQYLADKRNITVEDLEAVVLFAENPRWKVDIPLWCLSKSFTTVKDQFFVKELSDLHLELELILENSVCNIEQLGNVIDTILGIQLDEHIFCGLGEIIQLIIYLHYTFDTMAELLTGRSDGYKKTLLDSLSLKGRTPINFSWSDAQRACLIGIRRKITAQLNTDVKTAFDVLLTDGTVRTRFFTADTRLLCNFLLTKLKSKQHLDAFAMLVEDFEQAPISDAEWSHLINLEFDKLGMVVSDLFAERRWTFSRIKPLIQKVRCKQDLNRAIKVLNILYEYDLPYEAYDLNELRDDSNEWLPKTIEKVLAIIVAQHARETNQGRLLQMQTGEGKTYVVAAIAIFEALKGTKVDVITSSSELAVTQFNKLKDFYTVMGLTVMHNADNNAFHKFYKGKSDEQVYKANVVYGSADDYVADILRNEFSGREIRHNRKYELAIIDEVDSMMIDGRNHSMRLSSQTPGMSDLLQIHTTIWGQVMSTYSQMEEIDGEWYYKYQGQLHLLEDVSVEEFVRESTLPYLEKILRLVPLSPEEEGDENWEEEVISQREQGADINQGIKPKFPHIKFPTYMTEYVKQQLPNWVNSAIQARFTVHLGFNYVITDRKLVYVDAVNTGVHHPNMQYSDGLHQFLQMKHGCYLDEEGLTTNFMSNVTFFLRYESNILGLTGTIGGKSSRHFLREIYKVDFADIPPFKQRLHHELLPYVLPTDKDWLDTIVSSALEKLQLGRGVLIITQYIKFAMEIYDRLIYQHDKKNIRFYTDSNSAKTVASTLEKGQAIVATNIAGRGTDILVSDEAETWGGLHVILTFLPDNDRVERQNVGRTSRTGNRGTSQLIINLQHLSSDVFLDTIEEEGTAELQLSQRNILRVLREKRDAASMRAMKHAMKQLEKTIRHDAAFRKYLEIRDTVMRKNTWIPKEALKNSLDTRFGKHLKSEANISTSTVETHFKDIVNSNDLMRVFENPYDIVDAALELGELKKVKTFPKKKDYTNVRELLDQAMYRDKIFCAASYYHAAAMQVYDYYHRKDKWYINNAIEYFTQAKKALELKKLNQEIFLRGLSVDKGNEPKSELISQIERRTILTAALITSIEDLIGRNCTEDLEYFEKRLGCSDCVGDERTTLIKQRSEFLKQREVIEKGVLGSVYTSGNSINLKMVPLSNALPSSERVELFTKELEHFKNDMFPWIIEVNEKQPIKWWSVAAIAGLGVLQLIGGASAALFSLGTAASFGWSLMREGACDLIYAVYNGICERNISWAAYGIRKAISLTITLVSFGISAIKSAARGIVQGAKGAVAVARQTATRVTREGWKLAAKAIGMTVTKEVGKHAISRVVNYVSAKTVEKPIAGIIKAGVARALTQIFQNDKNLKILLQCDEIQLRAYYSEMFAGKVMGPLCSNNSLINELQEGVMDVANKGLERAGMDAEAKIFTLMRKGVSVITITDVVVRFLGTLSDAPSQIVQQERAVIDGILNSKSKQNTPTSSNQDYQVVADSKSFTMDEFLDRLADDITAFISSQLMGIARQYIVSKSADMIASHIFKAVNENIENHRERFIESKIVVNAIAEKRQTLETEEDKYTADYLEGIAQDAPGDLRQAETLAEVVRQPIVIRTKDDDGKEKVIRVGTEYSGKEAIELVFHRGQSPKDIGHYTLADGTPIIPSGENSCLIDAISKKTGYEPDLLRRGLANVMLNRFETVQKDLLHRDFADLCVGGKKNPKNLKRISIEIAQEDGLFQDPSCVSNSNGVTRHLLPANFCGEENKHKFMHDPNNLENGTQYTENEFKETFGEDCYNQLMKEYRRVEEIRSKKASKNTFIMIDGDIEKTEKELRQNYHKHYDESSDEYMCDLPMAKTFTYKYILERWLKVKILIDDNINVI
ncbi:hypothetical protein FO519_009242 [Halicephalobus sp. NKZ332]|nr:hypothetical protein FO519_009242 [Halicephalobus sp. NKZ332]